MLGLDWIAADWGTSNLRVWAMDRAGRVLAEAASDQGMSTLARDGYEAALLSLVGDWLPVSGHVPVVACGMVGSRQGWVEATYRRVPCTPLDLSGGLARPKVADARLSVHVIPGLAQAKPADVMRGEETQIAGYLATRPGFDGVLCLPGTHSKWAHVSAGEVVSFQTFMTGELFALLSKQSVLRHGMTTTEWDASSFDGGISDAISRPERIAAALFSLRAEGLLHDLPPPAARSRLSGLLIGAELAASKPYWLGRAVALIGAEPLCRAYATALAAQGVAAEIAPVGGLTLAGLAAARAALMEV